MTKSNDWLNKYSRNITSTTGEDGIIEKILESLNQKNQCCVEFGAADGREASNTYNLIKNHNYSGVLIEADSKKFKNLRDNYVGNKNTILLNKIVGFTQEDGLDKLLESTDLPLDFDVLSIDIDGNDYHAWKAINKYRPKVIIIEFNPTIPNVLEFVQPADMKLNQGSSLLSISKLAKEKRYELVATTLTNAFFVDSKYFHLFNISDNSIDAIHSNQSVLTYIFHGYDGTIFLKGSKQLLWHKIPYNESKLQQIPKVVRKYPPCYSKIEVIIAGFYFFFFRGKFRNIQDIKRGLSRLFSR